MRSRVVGLYIGAMVCGAIMSLVGTHWKEFPQLFSDSFAGWGALVGVAVLSEGLAIRHHVGMKSGSSSIMFIPLLASVQLFGPASAVALQGIAGSFGEIVRRKEPHKLAFNVSQGIVATAVAGWAFAVLKGEALESAGAPAALSHHYDPRQFLPFVAFALVFLAINHAAVALAIALSQQERFRDVWADILGHSGASLQDLLISPIAIVVAFLYVEMAIPGILLVLLPLLFIRHAYLTMSRLRQANDDLLQALIKAIETRDPYTSGHSLRVSHLARRIADFLGLPRPLAAQIEHAALLHDIGKIDAVFTGILMKPAALSPEERAVIESHVTKGEELLRNLSSVPDAVVRAVRHHHERADGTGYPDGLRGAEIPLGSRIIAVCDAVDAMLSDRPYRSALSLDVVLEQLRQHAGSQFDENIVTSLVDSRILQEYADMMRLPAAAFTRAVPPMAGNVGTPRRQRRLRASARQAAGD